MVTFLFLFCFSCLAVNFPEKPAIGKNLIERVVEEDFSYLFFIPNNRDSMEIVFRPSQMQVYAFEVVGSLWYSASFDYKADETDVELKWQKGATGVYFLINLKKIENIPLWYSFGKDGPSGFVWFSGVQAHPKLIETGSTYTRNNDGSYNVEVEFTVSTYRPYSIASFFVGGEEAQIKSIKFDGENASMYSSLNGKDAIVNFNNSNPINGKVFVALKGNGASSLRYTLNSVEQGIEKFPPEYPAGGELLKSPPRDNPKAVEARGKLPTLWGGLKTKG